MEFHTHFTVYQMHVFAIDTTDYIKFSDKKNQTSEKF
jgi:hypothetical protein